MTHKIGTVLVNIPGGNQYEVIDFKPNPGSDINGCYRLRCIDFWCTEDMGDGINCWFENQELWIASFHVFSMKIYGK